MKSLKESLFDSDLVTKDINTLQLVTDEIEKINHHLSKSEAFNVVYNLKKDYGAKTKKIKSTDDLYNIKTNEFYVGYMISEGDPRCGCIYVITKDPYISAPRPQAIKYEFNTYTVSKIMILPDQINYVYDLGRIDFPPEGLGVFTTDKKFVKEFWKKREYDKVIDVYAY